MAMECQKPVNSIYEQESQDDDGISLIDRLDTGVDEQNMITDKITVMNLLGDLNDREKQIILLRYFRGKTQSEVAKIIGVNQVQISRIERKVLENMRRKLKGNAVTA